jgi:hypothetical protein
VFLRYDPDKWSPSGIVSTPMKSLTEGCIVVYMRDPYRLQEIREVQHVDWPAKYRKVWVEHGMPDPDTWHYRPRMVIVQPLDQPESKPVHLGCSNSTNWHVLPEHFAVCRLCQEIPPCRHVHTERVVQRANDSMEKEMAILPGCCHGCREPITKRQKAFAFPGPNLIRPDLGDDSAIFHTRSKCMRSVASYDKRWAKAEEGRERLFFCDGTQTVHHDGTTECDNPQCVAQGAHRELVDHQCRIWHHPNGSSIASGCWCLAGATSGT